MKNLKQMIDSYSDDEHISAHLWKQKVSVSARINCEDKIKLEIIAKHFCKRQTPLLAEIIEASINEIFAQIHLEDDLKDELEQRMAAADSASL